MQMIRTLLLLLIAIIITAFVVMNWSYVARVRFWPVGEGAFQAYDWPVGFVALFFFVLGMVPMWLIHKGAAWRLKRRIGSLENTLKANTVDPAPSFPTSTKLDNAAAQEPPVSPL